MKAFQIKIAEEGPRGRISWKLARHSDGSKNPLTFESERAFKQWKRHRPWIEKVRKIPV